MPLHKPSLQCLRRPGQEPSLNSVISVSRHLSSSSEPTDLENSPFPCTRTSSTPSHTKPLSIVGQHCYPFFRDHLHSPYPTLQDKERIVKDANHTDVTLLSVSNWFANSRRRSGWIELCNEYYNGDTKRMVEICTHVMADRGRARNSDPPEIVDKILDMESKVRTWHEGRTEPSKWALILQDIIPEFTNKLQLVLKNSVETSEIAYPSPTCFGKKAPHTTFGTKRNLMEYLSDNSDSPSLSRSPSISSISSSSTSSWKEFSSKEYIADEGDPPTKRGRFVVEEEAEIVVSNSTGLAAKENGPFLLSESLQHKRCFSDCSDLDDSSNLWIPRKRLCTSHTMPEVPQLLGMNEQSPEPNSESQIAISENSLSSNLSVPTADLQSPDTTWNLDIGVYDWSSFSDLHLMLDPCLSDVQEVDLTGVTTTGEDTEDWLRLFFLDDSSKEPPEYSRQIQPYSTSSTGCMVPDQGEVLLADQPSNSDVYSSMRTNNIISQVLNSDDTQSTCPNAPYSYQLQGVRDYPSGLLQESDNFLAEFPEASLLEPCISWNLYV